MFAKKIILFDASASGSKKVKKSVGSFLIFEEEDLDELRTQTPDEIYQYTLAHIQYCILENYKSTLAELNTFLYITKQCLCKNTCYDFYSDCQTL